MSFLQKMFGKKSSNTSNNKKSKKRSKKNESALYYNSNSQKYKVLAKNEFTVSEFQKKYGVKEPRFQTLVRANVVIMYDIDAPKGEGEKNNKLYVHYLSVKKKVIIPYRAPNPPEGNHNYYAVSLKIDNPKVLKTLLKLDDGDRVPEVLQDLHSKKKILDLELTKPHMLKITHLKIKQDPKESNKKEAKNNGKKSNKKSKKKSSKTKNSNQANTRLNNSNTSNSPSNSNKTNGNVKNKSRQNNLPNY